MEKGMSSVQIYGIDAAIRKADIKSLILLWLVHPHDCLLLAIQSEGQKLIDKLMQMRCSVACFVFETFNSFLEMGGKNGRRV